jgi:hypothetical protein
VRASNLFGAGEDTAGDSRVLILELEEYRRVALRKHKARAAEIIPAGEQNLRKVRMSLWIGRGNLEYLRIRSLT